MTIDRRQTSALMSQAVIHNEIVYLAGQVASDNAGADVTTQTKEVLARIDSLLKDAGTDKSKLLTAQIWLVDIKTFPEMNAVWKAWLPEGCGPARATVEGALAKPEYTVEIMVVAAR